MKENVMMGVYLYDVFHTQGRFQQKDDNQSETAEWKRGEICPQGQRVDDGVGR
jgi:hypothetical protein